MFVKMMPLKIIVFLCKFIALKSPGIIKKYILHILFYFLIFYAIFGEIKLTIK